MEYPALYKIIKGIETVNHKDQPQFKKVIVELERLYPFTFKQYCSLVFPTLKLHFKKCSIPNMHSPTALYLYYLMNYQD